MVGMAVTEDNGLNLCHIDLQRIHVVEKIPRIETRIKQNRPAFVPSLHTNEDGKPVLSNRLRTFKGIWSQTNTLGYFRAGHQQIDAIIQDDGDLDLVDLEQGYGFLRHTLS